MRFSPLDLVTRSPARFALLASLLVAPALGAGLVLDDYFLATQLRDASGVRWAGLLDAFTFAYDVRGSRELGELPWWSDDTLRLRFLRPLAALTHVVDLWFPPWVAHVQSALWLALTNLAAARWYERLLGERAAAWAVCLFALAPGHLFAAAWIANRSALLATLFGIWALSSHDRARREGAHAWLAPILLFASLLCGELGISTFALLFAHACCLDERAGRFRALVPALVITLAWLVVHHALGYGAHASSMYLDPIAEPYAYVRGLATHLPLLAFSQWGFPIVGFAHLLAPAAMLWFALLAVAVMLCWLPSWRALWREDARARFALVAMALTYLPIAATAPHDRLTLLADVPAFALLGLILERARPPLRRWIGTRLAITTLLALASAASLQTQAAPSERAFASVGSRPVFVNPPSMFYTLFQRRIRQTRGEPPIDRVRALAPSVRALDVERLDARTLRLHLREPALPWFSPAWLMRTLDAFARRDPLRAGQVTLSDVAINVDDQVLDFRFTQPLEQLELLQWTGAWTPFVPPAVGERVHLPAGMP
ncbi:MAG: hypothetical protein ABW352_05800 [Polyangiales bacterium]